MRAVTQELLPLDSSPKFLQLLPTNSVRRRRLIVVVFLVLGVVYLLFRGLRSYVRQNTPQDVLLLPDVGPRPTVALSPLGLEADDAYHLGSLSLTDYTHALQAFIDTAFPPRLKGQLSKQLHRFLDLESADPLPERPKIIWQTNDILPVDRAVQSWQELNPDYEYRFLHDEDSEEWVQQNFKGSVIEWTWNKLPHPVMVSILG